MGSGGNSLVSLADSDSDIAVVEQVFVPKGTVTFQEGEVSTTTTIAISFAVSVRLAVWNAYFTGPGDPQIDFVKLVHVRSGHDVLVCVGDQENSEKTEIGACPRALDLGRYTRAHYVTRCNQRIRATRRTKEEH